MTTRFAASGFALLALLALGVGCARPASVAEPVAAAAPRQSGDLAQLGSADSILFWTPEQQLAGYRNMDRIYPTRSIPASENPYPLPHRLRDLSGVRYVVDGETFDLGDFLEHNHVAGLLAIKDGVIVLEHYALGNGAESRWVSFSIAKSVVSMLLGAAIRDGYLESVEEPVTDYLHSLRGTSYEGVRIRHALHMASGVEWNEDYADPDSDVSRQRGSSLERIRYLRAKTRVAKPGERFNYNTAETHLVGGVVRAAIGNNLSTYLGSKIWQPFGMEADANWLLVQPGGAEHGGCCISATLRDYGRIGLFALRGGVLEDGIEMLPGGWMEESTRPSPAFDGYGYLWWLREGGVYNALGIFGQAISIDPAENVVIVTHSAWPKATDRELSRHRASFFAALTRALSDI